MFAYTTGGPFGMEEMVTTSGPGLTLLYLLVLPFFWCIPVSLVAAELTTTIPVEAGSIAGCARVSETSGDFWPAGGTGARRGCSAEATPCSSAIIWRTIFLFLPAGNTTQCRWRLFLCSPM